MYTGAPINVGDLTPYLTYGGGALREKIYRRKVYGLKLCLWYRSYRNDLNKAVSNPLKNIGRVECIGDGQRHKNKRQATRHDCLPRLLGDGAT